MRVQAKWNWGPAFEARGAGRRAVKESADRLLQRANSRAPIDTGALRASARVVMDEGRGIVAYDVPYATIVHEMVGARFRVGEPKWLERAQMEQRGDFVATVAGAVRRQIG